jgi:hypothetical protein
VHEYGLGLHVTEEKRTFSGLCLSCSGEPEPLHPQASAWVCAEGAAGALTQHAGRSVPHQRGLRQTAGLRILRQYLAICPVGALTAKQSKHRSRPWNVERHPRPASTGGGTRSRSRRGNEVIRCAPRNHYLCAKGRFGWDAVRHETRITSPKIRVGENLVDCSWDEALSIAATTQGHQKPLRLHIRPSEPRTKTTMCSRNHARGDSLNNVDPHAVQIPVWSEHRLLRRRTFPTGVSMRSSRP